MNILLISMYSDKWNWKKQHKLYRKAIGKNAKLIIKRYYDKSGIRKVLDSRKINGIIISGSDYFVLKNVITLLKRALHSCLLKLCFLVFDVSLCRMWLGLQNNNKSTLIHN